MTSYRPIVDTWYCARPKVKYYGAFPSGFLERARAFLCSEDQPLLHVCAGRVRDYPFAGFGPLDKTVDLDPATKPDFLMDVREICLEEPWGAHPNAGSGFKGLWPAVLIDRPYTDDDAKKYTPLVHDKLPNINDLLKRCLSITRPGGCVGVLDYFLPRPPKQVGETRIKFVADISVRTGFGCRARVYSVFRRELPRTAAQKKRTRDAIRGKVS